MKAKELRALAERVQNGSGVDNALDVQIEIALFEPYAGDLAVRADQDGSKVIYTLVGGNEEACWAPDWTFDREASAAALHTRASFLDSPKTGTMSWHAGPFPAAFSI